MGMSDDPASAGLLTQEKVQAVEVEPFRDCNEVLKFVQACYLPPRDAETAEAICVIHTDTSGYTAIVDGYRHERQRLPFGCFVTAAVAIVESCRG